MTTHHMRNALAGVPEHRLLLACASAHSSSGLIEELTRSVNDWASLLEQARGQSLLPLLAFQLRSYAPPPEATRLREAGIPALPPKGPALAELLHEDPAMRPFSDLDILASKTCLARALSVLAGLGSLLPPHLARLPVSSLRELTGEALLRSKDGLAVDLHWTVAGGTSTFEFDPRILWRESPEPRPESLLLFLCVHGAKHMWARLGWLADLARLVPKIDNWDRALSLAEEAGALRPVQLGLLLARDVLCAGVPPAIAERADEEVRRLARGEKRWSGWNCCAPRPRRNSSSCIPPPRFFRSITRCVSTG